jgi:glycine hydroxymethyltransferase
MDLTCGISEKPLSAFARNAVERLYEQDSELATLLEMEYRRQMCSLSLVASSSIADSSVLACEGTFVTNVTAEGYPGSRYHAGCEIIDQIELLAIQRAKALFSARYANVQPLTASIANQIVFSSLLRPGDTILGLDLDDGGHLSHGSKVNLSGRQYNGVCYGLTPDGVIDYEGVRMRARQYRPKLIICGTTAYPRTIDFSRFREIADEVGAYLLADITHIAGLVVAGLHPSPIDFAHITTTCTHKQLYGPRGGLILAGKDANQAVSNARGTLADIMQKGVFPLVQGAPIENTIAAKARALARAATLDFRELAMSIVSLAKALAGSLACQGMHIVSGGTDNHIVLVDVKKSYGISGKEAQNALEACHIIVNKNRVPGDRSKITVGEGIRIGTNTIAARGFVASEMKEVGVLIARILVAAAQNNRDAPGGLSQSFVDMSREHVERLCCDHPIVGYAV